MQAAKAHPCKVFDCSARISTEIACLALEANYAGIIRYVELPLNSPASDISASEVAILKAHNLSLMLVQHVRYPGWKPNQHNGTEDANVAAYHATAVGYPAGAHLWLDLEGIAETTPEGTTKYANDWATAAKRWGFLAGLYVGYDVPLTPLELYDLPDFNSYWKDAGPRSVATRGFAVKQETSSHIGNLSIDADFIAPDQLGELPFWAI